MSTVRRALFAAVILGLLSACGGTETRDATPGPSEIGSTRASSTPATSGPVRYLALGDSVTSGEGVLPEETYPSRLASLWRATGCEVEVSNVAVTGYKSADVVVEELPAVAKFKPTLVTLMVGGNDIANGIGVDEYQTNVRTILSTLKDAGASIVTISQQFWDRTPVGEGYGTRQSLSAQRAEFNSVLLSESEAVGATYVDLEALFEEQVSKEMWLEDELHPTAEAYQGWATALFEKVGNPCGK